VTDTALLVEAIDRAGYRVTRPRRAVAELVADHDGHFTAADIVVDARRRRPGIGRATVFRTLDLLAEVGAVERVDLPDGGHAYVGCEPSHHHHLICTSCGRSTDVADCGMREVAREVERRSGYAVASHRLELFGTCPDCRAADARGA
jgi:Fe2+ or Zn2+ uptake regulation protein